MQTTLLQRTFESWQKRWVRVEQTALPFRDEKRRQDPIRLTVVTVNGGEQGED